MADETEVTDKAAAAQGAAAADMDPATQGGGNPAPAEPSNKPPADDPKPKGDDDAEAAKAAEEEAAKKAAEEAAAEEAKDKPLDTDVWGTTGDEVGDAALTLVQNAGLTTDEAKALLFDAVEAGDITKVDRAALAEKVGKEQATLIMAGVENYVSRSKAKAETIVAECHEAVGGKDNWDAVTTWAKENVSEADMADYVSMIDAGGVKARFAAQDLATRFNADGSNTQLEVGQTEIVPDTKAASSARSLTKAAYVAELEAAYASGATEAVINEINAARARGRSKGI